MKSSIFKSFWLLLIAVVLASCSSTPSPTSGAAVKGSIPYKGSMTSTKNVKDILEEQQLIFARTPYRLGGTSINGIDCSGFTQKTLQDRFDVYIPRTTAQQSKSGRLVSKSNLRAGDLVFFKTGRGPNGYHVGIYVSNGRFIHASPRGGIRYAEISNPYWKKTYWQARRYD